MRKFTINLSTELYFPKENWLDITRYIFDMDRGLF